MSSVIQYIDERTRALEQEGYDRRTAQKAAELEAQKYIQKRQDKLTAEKREAQHDFDLKAEQARIDKDKNKLDQTQAIALEKEKARLKAEAEKKPLTGEKKAKYDKEMRLLDLKIANVKGDGKYTTYQKELIRLRKDALKISQDKVNATAKKEEEQKERDILSYEQEIAEDMNALSALPLMDYINKNANKPYYYIQEGEDKGGVPILSGWLDPLDSAVEGSKVTLPVNPKTGKQITSANVRATAKENGISEKEVLKAWGIIK